MDAKLFPDLAAPWRFAAESATVMLDGLQALGKVQARFAALPMDMMRFDPWDAARWWEQTLAAMLETQARLLDCGMHLLDTGALLEAAHSGEK